MRYTQTATLLIVTVTAGLIAGLMFGYACSVMPGLGRSSDRTLIEAMQNINKAIINGWFMLPFLGTIPLLALAVFLAWRGHGRSALPWLIAALALYLIALFITSGLNVPLNAQLEKAGDPPISAIWPLSAITSREDGWPEISAAPCSISPRSPASCVLWSSTGAIAAKSITPMPSLGRPAWPAKQRGAGYLPPSWVSNGSAQRAGIAATKTLRRRL